MPVPASRIASVRSGKIARIEYFGLGANAAFKLDP
jgi:hypothetical protein